MKLSFPKLSGKQVLWGVAGLGKFSEQNVIPVIMQNRKAKLVSLYSHDLGRAQSLAQKCNAAHWFNEYDAFLNSGIDAVFIGSTNDDHYEQVIRAARAGKHILCEKPLCITSAQAEDMVRVCKENDVFLAVDFVYRFHPLIQKAKELIDRHVIGKVVSIHLHFNAYFAPTDNFRFSKEKAGGALRDLGTHMIDLLRYLNGEMQLVSGAADMIIFKGEVDDFANGLFRFDAGGFGYFTVSFNSKSAFNRLEILGHSGAIAIDGVLGRRNGIGKMTILLDGERSKAFRRRANKLQRLFRSVNDSFLKNLQPLITGEDGLINLQLIEAIEAQCNNSK